MVESENNENNLGTRKKTKEKPENKDTEKKIHFNWQ